MFSSATSPKPQRKSSNELKLTFLWSVERAYLCSVYCPGFGPVWSSLVASSLATECAVCGELPVWVECDRASRGSEGSVWQNDHMHWVARCAGTLFWRVCKQAGFGDQGVLSLSLFVHLTRTTRRLRRASEDGEEQKGGNVKLNAI